MKKILLFLSFLLMSIGVWGTDVKDILTSSDFAATSTTYTDFSNVSKASDATYAGQSAKDNSGNIQLRSKNSNSGVVSTTSGGIVKSVKITVGSGSNTVDVYGSNTAYTSASDLYGSNKGTKIGSVTSTGTITFTGNYTYVGIRSNNGAIYLSSIEITWETGSSLTTYTVTYDANGGTVSPSSWTQTSSEQATTLPTPSKDGYTFNGWYTASSGGSKIGDAGASYTPTADITLHAQWTENVIPPIPVDGETFELLTDIENLKSGDEIVILNTGGTYALSTTQNNNNRGSSTDFTLFLNTVTVTGNTVQVINVGGSVGKWTFNVGTGYLYAASSSSNYLRTQATNNADGEWSITLNGSNEATITAQGSNTRNILEFNAQNSIFACYGSASQVAVKIYKKVDNCTKTVPVRKGPETNGTFSIDKTEICADTPGGTVNVTDIIPANGYVFDTIICVTAKEPFAQLGTVNLSEKKVTGITDSCYITVIFKEKPNIDIVEWNPDWLKIDIENFTAATATLEDQNTQVEVKENIATKLFFSKYFEAAANIKLWAIYNGTKDTIPLTNVKVLVSSNGNAWDDSDGQKYTSLDTLGRIKKGYICPNEEIIVYNDGNKTGSGYLADTAIMNCVKKNYNLSSWYMIKNNTTAFSGDDGLLLLDGTDTLDIIGVMEPATINSHVIGTIDNPHGDGYGWCCENGKTVSGDSTALSTNRCLLIRKSTVHSGDSAVKYNRTNFVTLCSEWEGEVVEKNKDNPKIDAELTCEDFTYVGSYNYTDHYVGYDTIYTEKPISGQEDDGYYKIPIPQLDTLSCTNLKITVKDESNNELEKIVKIPIMVKVNGTKTTDDLFSKKKDCEECDVVVLKNITLIADESRTNRDVKLYEGAELRVPTSTSYTINSLAFRRYNDTVSSLKLDGTLTVNKVYFDLYITPDDWHYISLPDTFIVSNVKYVNGKSPRYGTDCLAKYYDGEYRSQHYKGGWKNVEAGMKFNPGNGFTFGLSDAFKKKEFRFELNPNVITYEKTNKNVVDLHAWGITNPSLAPNHIGWNLIGNPFMGHFDAEIYNKIRVDSLVKVIENGHWTGQWELSNTDRGKSLRYAVIPSKAPEDKAAGGYKSVVLDDMKLLPFTCFFVQLGDNGNGEGAQGIEFKSSRIINRIVARNYQEEEDDELFLRVKVDNWKTGMFISDQFSEEYEPGDDLESRYPIYQNLGGYKLLYSAINDSIIESGVTITAPQGRLCLDSKVDIDKFEYIYVNYNNNWYDLMHGEVIDIEAGDFILQAKRKVNNIPTGLDIMPTEGLYKFSDGSNVYINRNNTIFNILGTKIK